MRQKHYVWENEGVLTPARIKRLTLNFPRIGPRLQEMLAEVRQLGHSKITGMHLKDLVTLAFHESSNNKLPRTPKIIVTESMGNVTSVTLPQRRCMKCGKIYPTTVFLTPPTPKQAESWGYDKRNVDNPTAYRRVKGFENVLGKFTRGYDVLKNKNSKRRRISMLCALCRVSHKNPPRAVNPTYTLVHSHITKRLERIYAYRVNIKKWGDLNVRRKTWMAQKHALLKMALYLAQARRRDGMACPKKWENLLTDLQREQLTTAHAQVTWIRRIPEIF